MSIPQGIPVDLIDYYRFLTTYNPPTPLEIFLKDMENLDIKHILLCTGNNCGKTLSVAVLVMWFLKELPKKIGRPISVLVVTAQSKKLLDYLRQFGREHQELVSDLEHSGPIFDLAERGFSFKDGSECKIRVATSKQVSGEKADLVIIDEAGLVKDWIVKNCWNNLNGKGIDRVVLISTPARNSLFNEYYSNASSRLWKVYHWTQFDCPWNKAKIEAQRLNQGENSPEWQISVLGEIPNILTEFIFREEIKRCIKIGPAFQEGGETIAGLDLSEGARDKIALVILEKIQKKRKILYAKEYNGDIQKNIDEINRTLADFKVTIVNVDSQPPKVCLYVQETLITPYKIISPEEFHLKGRLVQNLRRLMNSGNFEIPEQHEDLISEFKDYHPEKCHRVDLCDATMLAAFEKNNEVTGTIFIKIPKEEEKVFLTRRDKILHELGEI
jgi:hypothetical protein